MQQEKPFNPREHLMTIKSGRGDNAKSSDYLPVQYRLVWFREVCPEGSIETEMVLLDLDKECEEEAYVWNAEKRRSEKVMKMAKGVAMFRAIVKDGKGGVATGTKMEKAVSFNDYVEKAETGAIGRALAGLGYGTQFAPELNEGERIVDAPVPSVIDKLKADWATVYRIADHQIEDRWPKYIVHVLGRAVADPDLQAADIAKINGDLERERRKTAGNKAS
jgi:hypothetical protein